jgi:transposase-like protein
MEKLRILTEALQRGATVCAVADNSISRSQLYAWKKLAREGRVPGHFARLAAEIAVCACAD